MPIAITVPRLGWSMEEGVFLEWLKRAGDTVHVGDLLYAMDSEKVAQDVESLDAGVLHIPADAPQPGEIVRVGQLLGYLLAAGESIPVPEAAVTAAPVTKVAAPDTPVSTPRARRVARELDVDWTRVPGTGRGGRIREADVRGAATSPASPAPAALTTARKVIAGRMLASQEKTAAVTLHTTADMTALVRWRRDLADFTPTYNDIFVKLAAAALRAHPVLNSRWGGESLCPSSAAHIGIAVDTDAGLLVPVIRDAGKLTLHEVASRARDLADRARTQRLSADELRGGTFTITNLGSFGIDAFTPIINYPECAILGVGRILRQPVAVGDAIGLRDIVTLSLTFDHRALDGAAAARFLQTLCRLIESPTEDAWG